MFCFRSTAFSDASRHAVRSVLMRPPRFGGRHLASKGDAVPLRYRTSSQGNLSGYPPLVCTANEAAPRRRGHRYQSPAKLDFDREFYAALCGAPVLPVSPKAKCGRKIRGLCTMRSFIRTDSRPLRAGDRARRLRYRPRRPSGRPKSRTARRPSPHPNGRRYRHQRLRKSWSRRCR